MRSTDYRALEGMTKLRYYGNPPNIELWEWWEAHQGMGEWDSGCPLCVNAVNRLMLMCGLLEGIYR